MTRVALFQPTTGIDPVANAAALVKAIEKAAAGGYTAKVPAELHPWLDAHATCGSDLMTSAPSKPIDASSDQPQAMNTAPLR